MPPKPKSPLDYHTIITRLPLHMHQWYAMQAAALMLDRARLYEYALKFAFHSHAEFLEFVRAHQKGKK